MPCSREIPVTWLNVDPRVVARARGKNSPASMSWDMPEGRLVESAAAVYYRRHAARVLGLIAVWVVWRNLQWGGFLRQNCVWQLRMLNVVCQAKRHRHDKLLEPNTMFSGLHDASEQMNKKTKCMKFIHTQWLIGMIVYWHDSWLVSMNGQSYMVHSWGRKH